MTINEAFRSAIEYRKFMIENANRDSNGRLNNIATDFYQVLGKIRDFLLVPENINRDLLVFMAKPDISDSLGPLIDLIQPRELQVEVRYRISVGLSVEIDRLVEKERKYSLLGLNDMEAMQSCKKLEKYLEEYYAKA